MQLHDSGLCIEWNWFKCSDALFFSKVSSSNFESLHGDSNRIIVNGKGIIGFEFKFKFKFYHRNATEKYR